MFSAVSLQFDIQLYTTTVGDRPSHLSLVFGLLCVLCRCVPSSLLCSRLVIGPIILQLCRPELVSKTYIRPLERAFPQSSQLDSTSSTSHTLSTHPNHTQPPTTLPPTTQFQWTPSRTTPLSSLRLPLSRRARSNLRLRAPSSLRAEVETRLTALLLEAVTVRGIPFSVHALLSLQMSPETDRSSLSLQQVLLPQTPHVVA